jgi:hypothetical protein
MRPLTGVLVILLFVAAAAVVLAVWVTSPGSPGSASSTPSPTSTAEPEAEPEYEYPDQDAVGVCFDPIADRDDEALLALQILDCDEPHHGEFMGIGQIDAPAGARWPGESLVGAEAEQLCSAIFEDYVGIAYEDSRFEMTIYFPVRETWEFDDRDVWCMAEGSFGRVLTTSVRDLQR